MTFGALLSCAFEVSIKFSIWYQPNPFWSETIVDEPKTTQEWPIPDLRYGMRVLGGPGFKWLRSRIQSYESKTQSYFPGQNYRGQRGLISAVRNSTEQSNDVFCAGLKFTSNTCWNGFLYGRRSNAPFGCAMATPNLFTVDWMLDVQSRTSHPKWTIIVSTLCTHNGRARLTI